jgi:hypothetical protein
LSRNAVAAYVEAEVKCYHCGHTSGVIRQDRGVPTPPTVFVNADGGPEVRLKSLTELRCTRCQGSVFTDEFEVRYVYPKVDFLDERPRRGRPPKRLVEMRRAQEAALKSA